MKKSKDSIMFIAQGAFRGMIHEVYLMLSNKSEEKQSKIGHLASVILLIRLVGRAHQSPLRLFEGCGELTSVCSRFTNHMPLLSLQLLRSHTESEMTFRRNLGPPDGSRGHQDVKNCRTLREHQHLLACCSC